MGCCKTKIDEQSNINYEDDVINFDKPNTDNPMKAKGGNPNLIQDSMFGPSEDMVKTRGMLGDNPKFNKSIEPDEGIRATNRQDRIDFNNLHNGAKLSQGNSTNNPDIYNKLLILTIKESKFNKIGTTLEINQFGLKGSTRNSNDGIVYFGLHALDFKNDFCFKAEEGVNKQHFEIKFLRENKPGYYVKNLNGSGVFIKIDDYLNLKDGIIISFGTNHLLVSINNADFNDQRDNASNIKFKAIYGPNKNEE